MLVTFRSGAYGSITMLGNVAINLLKLLGHSGTIPGAIKAEDVPQALTLLKKAVEQEASKPRQNINNDDIEDMDDQVSLAQRAFPLIELLTNAVKNNCDVLWEE